MHLRKEEKRSVVRRVTTLGREAHIGYVLLLKLTGELLGLSLRFIIDTYVTPIRFYVSNYITKLEEEITSSVPGSPNLTCCHHEL